MNWDSEYVSGLVQRALAEDVGSGDATVLATIPATAIGHAHILAKQDLICAGLPLAKAVFRALDPAMQIEFRAQDSVAVANGHDLLHLDGAARAILTGERTALNFLAHLSGIATLTHKFVEKLTGTNCRIRDTRKTTPGLRLLEKYAVKMGGGTNHRIGLYDAVLLKENHIALAGGVQQALAQAHSYTALHARPAAMTAYEEVDPPSRTVGMPLPVQIEVRNLAELRQAIEAGADSVLLDNMDVEQAREAVGLARSLRASVLIEISGGITLENARAYAETGADFLSSGSLTHSAPAVDLSLLVDNIVAK
ncbi:MAG: carboxylating nicotinate-nucleotide diphosphorylase [Acidobacteria bacterium]|nr:carboxylating nicotinate-nucleotide diphosphorylase [Acidobacteriota bacterium]MBS1866625.1 carboxylating nicotinate-nucleotide diphosphorylase [Acidobacteriota bacterium]